MKLNQTHYSTNLLFSRLVYLALGENYDGRHYQEE